MCCELCGLGLRGGFGPAASHGGKPLIDHIVQRYRPPGKIQGQKTQHSCRVRGVASGIDARGPRLPEPGIGRKHFGKSTNLLFAGFQLVGSVQQLYEVKPGFKKFLMPGKALLQNFNSLVNALGLGQQTGQRKKDLGIGLKLQDFFIPFNFFRHGFCSRPGFATSPKR